MIRESSKELRLIELQKSCILDMSSFQICSKALVKIYLSLIYLFSYV